ncbi:MAG: hypothetical protein JST20_04810 [Bacteroidetes bacterium]|nr:hypothetical protein [Bacteroidota bacterium]
MIKNINELLAQEIKWYPIPESDRDFISVGYSKEDCYLRMNNFPDEPLWTLFYKEDNIDFDDKPPKWSIIYRSEL